METKELVSKVIDCVEIKINLKGVVDIVIDDLIEVSLDKAIAKTGTTIDDTAKALLWPIIEKEVKELAYEKVGELEAKIAEKIKELKTVG